MTETLWSEIHCNVDSSEDDKATAEVIRYLLCDSFYHSNKASNEVKNTELESRYNTLMRSIVESEGVPPIDSKRNESDGGESTLDFLSFIPPLASQLSNNHDLTTPQPIKVPPAVKEGLNRLSQAGYQPAQVNSKALPTSRTVSFHRDITETCPSREDEPKRPDPFHTSFRTATEQFAINNAHNNRGSFAAASSGQAKKSLGPRKVTGKFVAPVFQESSTQGTAALHSITGSSKSHSESSTFDEDFAVPKQLAHLDANIVKVIMNEIMDTIDQVSWSDISGLEFAKKTLREIIILPMLRPDIFSGLRGPPKGLLLFGPPGTGKTLIGKCVASQSKCTFFSISASSLTSKWIGEGEKLVRALFAVARYKQPSVVFIDEIDSLLTQRSESEHESSRRIKTEFLVQMDGVGCGGDDRILIIGATNRPQELDEAARRRFVKRLYIPLPVGTGRRGIIENLMRKQRVEMSEDDLECVVAKTEGYSGSDMTNLCKEAALGPVRDIQFEEIETIAVEQVRPIQIGDFTKALKQVRASVDCGDLDSYLSWNSKFGSWEIQPER